MRRRILRPGETAPTPPEPPAPNPPAEPVNVVSETRLDELRERMRVYATARLTQLEQQLLGDYQSEQREDRGRVLTADASLFGIPLERIPLPRLQFTPAMQRVVMRLPAITERFEEGRFDGTLRSRFTRWQLVQGRRICEIQIDDRTMDYHGRELMPVLTSLREELYYRHFDVWLDFDRFQAGVVGLHDAVEDFGRRGTIEPFIRALETIGGSTGERMMRVARETWPERAYGRVPGIWLRPEQ